LHEWLELFKISWLIHLCHNATVMIDIQIAKLPILDVKFTSTKGEQKIQKILRFCGANRSKLFSFLAYQQNSKLTLLI